MKRLSDYKNEEALDLLVEILEPATEIMSDKEVISKLYSKEKRMEGVKQMISAHEGAVMHILAALDGVPVDQYECSFLTLPMRLIEILNDKELLGFFMEQQMNPTEKPSSSAMENTEANGD